MNSITGKSTGIALLMAAALLAALFAMGVFSPTGVGADGHVPSASVDKEGVAATNVTMTISFEVDRAVVADDPNTTGDGNDEAANSQIVVTLPDDFQVTDIANRAALVADTTHANSGTTVQVNGNDVEEFALAADPDATTPPEDDGATVTITNAEPTDGVPAQIMAGDIVTVTIKGLTNPTNADLNDDRNYVVSIQQGVAGDSNPAQTASFSIYDAVLSSDTPGAAVSIDLHTTATADVDQGEDITVNLEGFGLPTTIAESRVIIDADNGGTENNFSGSPSEVLVSGSNVILTVPSFLPNGGEQNQAVGGGAYTVTFKQSAGITNPTSAGTKTIKVSDNDDEADELEAAVRSAVTVSPDKGASGTDITVTGKGFTKDLTASITVNGDPVGSATVGADNTFTATLDSAGDAFTPGDNTISATVANVEAQKTATFEVTGKVTLDPASTVRAKEITIKLSDWTAGDVTGVSIGGVAVMVDDDNDAATPAVPVTAEVADNKAELKVKVPETVATGVQPVDIFVAGDDGSNEKAGSANVTIGTLDLNVSPPTASMGESVTVTGTGFAENTGTGHDIVELSVGTAPAAGASGIEIVSGGSVSFTFSVPIHANIKQGTNNRILVKAWDNREGTADLMIREPAITINPSESRIGTDVTVSGTGFIAGELVRVSYAGNDRGAALADGSGNFTTTITVPNTGVGDTNAVVATSTRNDATTTAEADHSTPDATVTIDPAQAQPGTFVTISGDSFQPHVTVSSIEIAGTDVTPSPKPITDENGAFSTSVLAPFAALGDRVVKVTVGSGASPATKTLFVAYVDTPVVVPTDPAEVFAEIGDRLARVWYLERQSQDWSFYDPDPEVADFNNLLSVSSGQVVQIIVSDGEPVPFQGMTLYAGTNPISLR